jgi:hypothetical protein
MKSFYLQIIIFFICGCNSSYRQTSKPESPPKIISDTTFRKQIPDTTLNWYAKYFDYRYFIRSKKLAQKLNIPSIENGTGSLEMRLWQISSWINPQTVYVLKHKDDLWEMEKFQFSVNFDSWDTPSWMNPDIKFLKTTEVIHKSISPITFIDSLNIESLWRYPSQSEMKDCNMFADCANKYAIVIELADNTKYKIFFYQCPDKYLNMNPGFKKVTELQQAFSNAFSKL